MKSWDEVKREMDSRLTPEELAEQERWLRRRAQRDRVARALTDWMRYLPYGQLTRVFWYSLLSEGLVQTVKPRWGALTFSFLNDGYKPTIWHTHRQITTDVFDKFNGTYPGGAPRSLQEAVEWDLRWEEERQKKS